MKRLIITIALSLSSACDQTASDSSVSCKASSDCPFQQCCQSGSCIDPGIIGTCTAVTDLHGTITFDKNSATAGVDAVTVTVALHDLFNRPLKENRSVTVTVSSTCTTSCDSLSPGAGSTDATGRFSSTLTSNLAGTQTVTLAINTSTHATSTIDFVANSSVIQIGFGGSIFDAPLGSSLGNGRVGIVDTNGNFVTARQASSVPVTIQLATSGVSIPLVDASGNPLEGQLTVDVQNGPVALGNFYVPVAGERFAVSATTGAQPAVVSKVFTVAVDTIAGLEATPNPVVSGGGVSIAWSTGNSSESALTSQGLFVPISPATIAPTQTATYEAVVVDNRTNDLRTVAISSVDTMTVTGTGDIRVAYASNDEQRQELIAAGDYQGTMTFADAIATTPAPSQKTGYTSFVSSVLNNASEWAYTLSSDNSSIVSVTGDSTQLYVVAEYTGAATWSNGASAHCSAPSTGTGLTGIIIAAIRVADGALMWCTSASPYSTHPASVTGGFVAYSMNVVYVAFNCGPYLTFTSSGGSSTPYMHGSPAVPQKMVVFQFSTNGVFNADPSIIADYPYIVTDLIANPTTGDVVIAGGATTSGALVLSSDAQTITTTGQDALVLALSDYAVHWVWQSNGAGDETAQGLAVDSFGNIAVVGTFSADITVGNRLTNADAIADGFVTVLGASDHTATWGDQLHSASSLDNLTVMANDGQLIVGVTNEGPLTVDTSIVGMCAAGAMSIAYNWSGSVLSVVPMPGCRSGYATPTSNGGSTLFVNVPNSCTINPFDIGGNPVATTGPTAVFLNIAPYDF